MKKLILIAAGGIFFFFLLIITGALLIAPGSYPYAEPYILNIPYDEIVEETKKFKEKNPEFQYLTEKNGEMINLDQNDKKFIDFYLSASNNMVSCRVLPLDDQKNTSIRLVYVWTPLIGDKFKEINTSDLNKDDNKKIKKEFETEVLDKLGKWDHETPGFLRFLGFP